jgi:hypothetical protein
MLLSANVHDILLGMKFDVDSENLFANIDKEC